jgi:hypothetical protein
MMVSSNVRSGSRLCENVLLQMILARGKDGTGVSPDPSDPEQTLRVLTLYAADDVLA